MGSLSPPQKLSVNLFQQAGRASQQVPLWFQPEIPFLLQIPGAHFRMKLVDMVPPVESHALRLTIGNHVLIFCQKYAKPDEPKLRLA